jgi:hypothetical protein
MISLREAMMVISWKWIIVIQILSIWSTTMIIIMYSSVVFCIVLFVVHFRIHPFSATIMNGIFFFQDQKWSNRTCIDIILIQVVMELYIWRCWFSNYSGIDANTKINIYSVFILFVRAFGTHRPIFSTIIDRSTSPNIQFNNNLN